MFTSECLHELDHLFDLFRKEDLTFDQKFEYINNHSNGLVEIIGSGSSSDVYLVTTPKEVYALKAVREVSMYKRELAALQRLSQHPYLVELKGITTINRHYCLCFENLSDHVSLWEYIRTRPQCFPEAEVLSLFCQMVSAVHYMHQRWVSHHDLNTHNVMIHEELKTVKIIDFGLALVVPLPLTDTKLGGGEEGQRMVDHAYGTPLYLPLEVLEGKMHDPLAVDVWSLGVILVEMLLQFHPWKSSKSIEQLTFNIRQKINLPINTNHHNTINSTPTITNTDSGGNCCTSSRSVSLFTSQLVELMLTQDPASRATIQQVDLFFKQKFVSLVV